MQGIIYKITNLVTGKVYIGQTTKTLDERYTTHIQCANRGDNQVLYRAMRKYGIDNFKAEVVEVVDCGELDNKEIHYIQQFNSFIHFENSNGYNMTLGGGGKSGYVHSEETKRKMSENANHVGENNPMYGKRQSKSSIVKNIESQPTRKPVIQLTIDGEFVAEHLSIKSCAKAIGGNETSVRDCCKGKAKTHKGYRFIYKEEYIC